MINNILLKRTESIIAYILLLTVSITSGSCGSRGPAVLGPQHQVQSIAVLGPVMRNYQNLLRKDMAPEPADQLVNKMVNSKRKAIETELSTVFHVVSAENYLQRSEIKELLNQPCPNAMACGNLPNGTPAGYHGGAFHRIDQAKAQKLCAALGVDAIMLVAVTWSTEGRFAISAALHGSIVIYDKTGKIIHLASPLAVGENIGGGPVRIIVRSNLAPMYEALFDQAIAPSLDRIKAAGPSPKDSTVTGKTSPQVAETAPETTSEQQTEPEQTIAPEQTKIVSPEQRPSETEANSLDNVSKDTPTENNNETITIEPPSK